VVLEFLINVCTYYEDSHRCIYSYIFDWNFDSTVVRTSLELIQVELEKVKFFAKPKLGLDCVGGASALRLSDALAQVS